MDASANAKPLPDDARVAIDGLDDLLGSMIDGDRAVDALLTIRAIGDVAARRSPEAAAAAVDASSSWAEIGVALGISKQAAHQRFGASIRDVRAKLDAQQRASNDLIASKFRDGHDKLDAYLAKHPDRIEKVRIAREKLLQEEAVQGGRVDKHLDKVRAKLDRYVQQRLDHGSK